MSHKSNLRQYPSIVAGNMAGNLTSPVTNIQFLDLIGLELDVTGTPSGTIAVQVSASYSQDNNGNVLNAGQWTTLTSQTITSGSPTTTYIDIIPTSAPWIRLTYTASSGSGTLNAFVTGKSV